MVFWVVDFLQKTNKNMSTWGIIVVKLNSFVHFLEEIDDPKNHFEINRPLWTHSLCPRPWNSITGIAILFKIKWFLNREIPTTKIARMLTGPEVRGCRPILIHFANWKDREEVLAKSRLLRGTNIYVTEDLSRKIREHRNELNKFMREVCIF